ATSPSSATGSAVVITSIGSLVSLMARPRFVFASGKSRPGGAAVENLGTVPWCSAAWQGRRDARRAGEDLLGQGERLVEILRERDARVALVETGLLEDLPRPRQRPREHHVDLAPLERL